MPRRKTLEDELWDILPRISVVYVLFMAIFWFSNKALFLKLLLWGSAFVVVFIIVALFIKKSKVHKQSQWRTDRDLLYWLKGMKPKEFEEYIADLFSRLGYKTEIVGGGYDRGVDVIAEKDGLKHYIQCKKYITSVVGVSGLRDFYGAIADHLAQAKGYFITTNKFTLEAERFAEDKPVELIDGFKLIQYIRLAEKETKPVIEKLKKCPQCNGNLIERQGKFGKFYGCSNYPKCQYTENIKK
jgi:restriction system protein